MKKLLSILSISVVSTYASIQTISCDFIDRIKFNLTVLYVRKWLKNNPYINEDAYKTIEKLLSDYFKETDNVSIAPSYWESDESKVTIKIYNGKEELKPGDKFESGQDITIEVTIKSGDKYFATDSEKYHIGII